MAELNLDDVEKTIDENGFVTVSEPAVGAGGMVIAVADVIEELGFDPSRHLWVEAIELSQTSFHMAYVQINARGVAGKVIHGNSLSLQTFTSAYTTAAHDFYSQHGHPFAKQLAKEKLKAKEKEKLEQKQIEERTQRFHNLATLKTKTKNEQLGLFN
jgi:hypothetical protein